MKYYEDEKFDSLISQQEMLVVAHAEDFELANEYAQLLDDSGIPCQVKNRDSSAGEFGVVIVVPEDYYDEAHMIIESAQENNGFYDFFFEDPDMLDDMDQDYFDEDDL